MRKSAREKKVGVQKYENPSKSASEKKIFLRFFCKIPLVKTKSMALKIKNKLPMKKAKVHEKNLKIYLDKCSVENN